MGGQKPSAAAVHTPLNVLYDAMTPSEQSDNGKELSSMRPLSCLGLLALAGLTGTATAARADVFVRVPFIRVYVGSRPAPVAQPAPVAPASPVVPGDPPPVPVEPVPAPPAVTTPAPVIPR